MKENKKIIGDYTGIPALSTRAGLKIVKFNYKRNTNWNEQNEEDKFYGSSFGCSHEIITNAYGNGFVNREPDYIEENDWNEIIKIAKNIERK